MPPNTSGKCTSISDAESPIGHLFAHEYIDCNCTAKVMFVAHPSMRSTCYQSEMHLQRCRRHLLKALPRVRVERHNIAYALYRHDTLHTQTLSNLRRSSGLNAVTTPSHHHSIHHTNGTSAVCIAS